MNQCKHQVGFIFTLDYTAPMGCSTCGNDGGSLYINRYCAECKEQLGWINAAEEDLPLATLEFTSPEMTGFFEQIKKGDKCG